METTAASHYMWENITEQKKEYGVHLQTHKKLDCDQVCSDLQGPNLLQWVSVQGLIIS